MKITVFENDTEYQISVNNEKLTIELSKVIRYKFYVDIDYETIIKVPIKKPINVWNKKATDYWLPKLKTLNLFS